jgi:hypothetical protein
MDGEPKVRGRPLRRLTRLLLRPNKLRRSSDRIEAVIVLLLSAMFLAAVAAAPYLGMRIYQSETTRAAHLRPTMALLSQSGPTDSYRMEYGPAAARWRLPDGQWRSGTLTTETAPAISGASAGTWVRVWLNPSGQPAGPPASGPENVSVAAVLAFFAAWGAGAVLVICYWLCRLALDQRRLAGWELDWALTGPRWTTRRR